MAIRPLLRYIVRIAVFPGRTAEQLLGDPQRLSYGVTSWLTMSVLCAFAVIVGYLNGFGAVVQPWLPIPAGQYYLWLAPLTPLVFLVILVVLAGLVQLLGQLCRGQGSFEDTFAAVSLGTFLPTFLLMWIPEALSWCSFPTGGDCP